MRCVYMPEQMADSDHSAYLFCKTRSSKARSPKSGASSTTLTSVPISYGFRRGGTHTLGMSAGAPSSNWTVLDVWESIMAEDIPVVPFYFAKERPVVERDGCLVMVDDERMPPRPENAISHTGLLSVGVESRTQ
jgi:hypothetical protein